MEFDELDEVALVLYTSMRKAIDNFGKKGAVRFFESMGSNMNVSKFYSPKYQNMSDKEFAWEFLRNSSELTEDIEGFTCIEKLKKYEEENNVDLYELYPDGEIS